MKAEEKRKAAKDLKKKNLEKTMTQSSMDSFVTKKQDPDPEPEVVPYNKSTEKYKRLKEKLTIVVACTTISQNAIQTVKFKSYIAECDPRAEASIPSRPTLSKWVSNHIEVSTSRKL